MWRYHLGSISNKVGVYGMLVALHFTGAGCSQPAPQAKPVSSQVAVPRPPRQTVMLKIEFNGIDAAKSSAETLKSSLNGVATVENGPFVQGGTPFVRLAVSISPQAPVEPVLKKLQAVTGVKGVTIVR